MFTWLKVSGTAPLPSLHQVCNCFKEKLRSLGMYDYLTPQGNIYTKQYEANKVLFVRTKATIELALKWSVRGQSSSATSPSSLGMFSVVLKVCAWLLKDTKEEAASLVLIPPTRTPTVIGNSVCVEPKDRIFFQI